MDRSNQLSTCLLLVLTLSLIVSCSKPIKNVQKKTYYQVDGYFFSIWGDHYFIPSMETLDSSKVTPQVVNGKSGYKLRFGCGLRDLLPTSKSFYIGRKFSFENADFSDSGVCHIVYCTMLFNKTMVFKSHEKDIFRFTYGDSLYSFSSDLFQYDVLKFASKYPFMAK